MKHSSIATLVVLCVSLISIIVICSCGDKSCEPRGGDGSFARTTVDSLLDFFAGSFEEKDIERYDECMEEGFTFEFIPEDAESLGLPAWHPWWDKTDDTVAVANLFRAEYITDLGFDIEILARQTVVEDGDTVVVLRVEPTISAVLDTDGGDPVVYIIHDSWLDIVAAPDPADKDLWVIRRMQELSKTPLTGAGPRDRPLLADASSFATWPTTLGSLKGMFFEGTVSLRRTVDGLLEVYTGSCDTRDINLYDDCLDDNHLFVFTPEDADSLGLPPTEPWWGKTLDLVAMNNLFDSPDVVSISFDLHVLSSNTVHDGDDVSVELHTEPDIRVVIEEAGEEPMMLRVNHSYLDFKIAHDTHNPELWNILEIQEIEQFHNGQSVINGLTSSVEGMTFGSIKAMFK